MEGTQLLGSLCEENVGLCRTELLCECEINVQVTKNFGFVRVASIILTQRFSNIRVIQDHLECLKKYSLLDSTFRISDSVSLGWGLKIFTFNKLPGDANVAGMGATL